MEALFAITLGLLTASGVYLLLRARTFPVVLGLTLISYAVNLFLFAMGRLGGSVAVIGTPGEYGDPLPQALVLTAIVIGFALMCFALVLVMQLVRRVGTDDALALRLVEPEPADPVKPPLAFDAVHADDDARPQRADT